MRPMSSPYLTTVSPFFRGLSATLWPIGISSLALSASVLSVAVMTPSMSVPARSPSTTTTPTLSFGLWTRKCGVATRFPLVSRRAPMFGWVTVHPHSYIRHGRRPSHALLPDGASMSLPDKDANRPLYAQVRERLIDRIRSGEWKPGQLIANEFDIAAEFGVSQGTARKAISDLASEGLVVRRQGLGTFVVEHTPAHVLFRFFNLFDV